MKIECQDEVLYVSNIPELSAANAHAFRKQVGASWPGGLKAIEIDLAGTSFVDSCGLGALIALQKTAANHNGGVPVRLLNPTPSVQMLIELTQMHRLFEVGKR